MIMQTGKLILRLDGLKQTFFDAQIALYQDEFREERCGTQEGRSFRSESSPVLTDH